MAENQFSISEITRRGYDAAVVELFGHHSLPLLEFLWESEFALYQSLLKNTVTDAELIAQYKLALSDASGDEFGEFGEQAILLLLQYKGYSTAALAALEVENIT